MTNTHDWVTMFDGVRRKIVADGDKIMQVRLELRKGAAVPRHQHIHEQVSFVHSGRMVFDVEGALTEAGPGDTLYIPSMAWHGVTVLEDCVALDTFAPPRADFRAGTPPDPAIYGRAQ